MRKQKKTSGQSKNLAVFFLSDTPYHLTKEGGKLALMTLLCLAAAPVSGEDLPSHLTKNNVYASPTPLLSDLVLTADSGTTNVISGPLNGSSKFTYAGADVTSRLILANHAAASFKGPIEVAGGTLTTSGNQQPLGTGLLTLSGGQLELPGNTRLSNNIQISSAGPLPLQIHQESTLQLEGQLSSHFPLLFNGPGTLSLNTPLGNNLEGGMMMSGGHLHSSGLNPFGGNNSPFTYEKGNIVFTGQGTYGNKSFIWNAPATLQLAPGSVNHVTAEFQGSAPLTIEGSDGELHLHASSKAYDGKISLNSGTVSIDTNSGLGSKGLATFNGGTLRLGRNVSYDDALVPHFNVTQKGGTLLLNAGTAGHFPSSAEKTTLSGIGPLVFKKGNTEDTLESVNMANINSSDFTGSFIVGPKVDLQLSTSDALNHRPVTLDGAQLTYQQEGNYQDRVSLSEKGGKFVVDAPLVHFSGTVDGLGTLVKSGAGTFTVATPLAHEGGTTIQEGLIKTSGVNSLGKGPLILEGGNLATHGNSSFSTPVVFNQSAVLHIQDSLTLSGPLSGEQGFTATGGGILTIAATVPEKAPLTLSAFSSSLNDPIARYHAAQTAKRALGRGHHDQKGGVLKNTFKGMTVLDNVTLRTYGDQPLGTALTILTPTGRIETLADTYLPNDLLLSGDSTISTIRGVTEIAGDISGIGQSVLNKTGKGRLILSGVNSFKGPTEVHEGILHISGQSVSPVTVHRGAQLQGSAEILAPVSLLGRLDLKSDTLTTNAFTFANDSKLQVHLNGPTRGRLNVKGDLIIGSNTSLETNPLNPILPAKYVIAKSSGTVSGQFTNRSFHTARAHAAFAYSPQEIALAVTFDPFEAVLPSGNLQNIGICFDQAASNLTPDMSSVLQTLNTLNAEELVGAFNLFDPSYYNVLQFAEEAASEKVRTTYSAHTYERLWNPMFSNDLYVTYIAEKIHQNSLGESTENRGYDDVLGGVVAGYDRFLNRNVLAGVGFSYARSRVNWSPDKWATGIVKSYTGYIGSTFFTPKWVIDAYGSYTYHSTEGSKRIYIAPGQFADDPDSPFDDSTLSAIDKNLHFAGDSSSYTSHLGMLYTRPINQTPFYGLAYADIDYIWIHRQGFNEKNGGVLDLQIHSKNSDFLRPEAGFGFGYTGLVSNSETVFCEINLAYVGMFHFCGRGTDANFIGNSCVFTVNGLKNNHNLFKSTVRLGLSSSSDFDVAFNYSGLFGTRYMENEGKVELVYRF